MGVRSATDLVWLVPCALVLAGCGVVPSSSALETAAAKTAEAGTARFESVTHFEDEGESSTSRSHGLVDYRRNRFDLTYEYDERTSSRVIVIGQTSYATWSNPDFPLPSGKHWVRYESDYDAEAHACDAVNDSLPDDWAPQPFPDESDDPGDYLPDNAGDPETDVEPDSTTLHEESGTLIFYGSGVGGYSDPGQVLSYLSDVGAYPNVIGRELIHDAATTHYHAKMDPRTSLRRALEKEKWSQQAIDCAVSSVSDDPFDVDAWVGDDGLVRRLVTTTATAYGESGRSISVDTTDFYDFGTKINIEPPAADDVLSADEWEMLERKMP